MQGRRFGREFKIEAVRLIGERGVSVAQAARDLDIHENVLRKWAKEFAAAPDRACFNGPARAGSVNPGMAWPAAPEPISRPRRACG
jgi:transposase